MSRYSKLRNHLEFYYFRQLDYIRDHLTCLYDGEPKTLWVSRAMLHSIRDLAEYCDVEYNETEWLLLHDILQEKEREN